jgi:hypothetical protein
VTPGPEVAGSPGAIPGADPPASRAGGIAVADELVALLKVPFRIGLVLTGIHAYLGIHVIAREVVWSDGVTAGPVRAWRTAFLASAGATLALTGAVLGGASSRARPRSGRRSWPPDPRASPWWLAG